MVLADEQDYVLLTKRSERMSVFAGAWVLPGGHIDVGESFEECAIREIYEETGIKIEMNKSSEDSDDLEFKYKGKPVDIVPYFAYESSIPMMKGGKINMSILEPNKNGDPKTDYLYNKLYDNPKYLRDQAPISHLIINFKVKLHLPADKIPVKLDPKEV